LFANCGPDLWVAAVFLSGAAMAAFVARTFRTSIGERIVLNPTARKIVGTILATLALWVVVSDLHCRSRLPVANELIGSLEWRNPSFDWFSLVLVIAVATWLIFKVRSWLLAVMLPCVIAFAVATSEAASYRVGVQSTRWATVATLALITIAASWFASTGVKRDRN
jgi:hypothetical protein